MTSLRRTAGIVGVVCLGLALSLSAHSAWAQGNVVMGFDALMAINSSDAGGTVMGSNSGFGGFGRFTYGDNGNMMVAPSATLGRYGAFEIRKQGPGGSGMGFNFSLVGQADNPVDAGTVIPNVTSDLFPLLDRSGWGINFDPTQYVAELVFRPMPGNNGNQLNLTLDSFDGFSATGERIAEQWQYNFTGLAAPTGTPDADGFYTVRNTGGSLAQANAGFNGPSYMFAQAPLPGAGDVSPDFNDFEGGTLKVPNGVRQIHIQTPYDDVSTDDHFEIKSLRIVKINPDPREVIRMDGHSGFSIRFGSPFHRSLDDPLINIGGHDYLPSEGNNAANTDQVSRFDQNGFTNIVLKSHDDLEVGGLALWQPGASQVFDGTNATVEVKAKLTVAQGAGQADRIQVVLKDKDGNDTGAGQGGDEYHADLLLNQFNTSTMTTVSIPLANFTRQLAGEFLNDGDNSLANFNLYQMNLETYVGAGLVNMEIESIRVMLPAPPGLPGDFNKNNVVDAADYTVWRDHLGAADEAALNGNGDGMNGVDAGDFTLWKNNFGDTPGAGALAGAVPEPTTGVMSLIVLGALAWSRRRAKG
ncbi:MAG: PEP-CTERM sorting domain-containing protein [Pirellulales bacterium]